MAGTDELRNMVMTFRVSELQMLLGYAGRNKSGRKTELQSRALELLRLKSTPVQMKIRELYKSIQQGLTNGQPGESNANENQKNTQPTTNISLFPPNTMNFKHRPNIMHAANSNLQNYPVYQQPRTMYTQMSYSYHLPAPGISDPSLSGFPVHPDVQLKKLPFYELRGELLKPSTLVPNSSSNIQERSFVFHLTPQQANDIAMNRDVGHGSKTDYVIQVQLRLCLLETSCEQDDAFPSGLIVTLNNKMVPLPNPIPSNKPGHELRRPPRPLNITPLCKLSPTVGNHISVSWVAEYGAGCYVLAVNLVKKLTSAQLLNKLKSKGVRHADFTTGLIKEKLSEDLEIATTSLRVSLLCPLGTVRMTLPCRSSTCTHLQCFDASLFLQMNERKPTWICPVCDKPALYDNLVIDGYFQEVLQSNKLVSGQNDIQVHQDGSWSSMPQKKEGQKTLKPVKLKPEVPPVLVDCDELEILPVENSEKPNEPKKKAIVVDLTLSDSEDEEKREIDIIPVHDVINTLPMQRQGSPNIITLDSPSPPSSPLPPLSAVDDIPPSQSPVKRSPSPVLRTPSPALRTPSPILRPTTPMPLSPSTSMYPLTPDFGLSSVLLDMDSDSYSSRLPFPL